MLNVKAMSGSHTGEYIGQIFLTMLEEWNIDKQHVLLVLRHSGANMVKGMRLAKMPDLSFSAHTLQLISNDDLSSRRVAVDILAKLKRVAHSVVAQQQLSVIQEEVGVPQHSRLCQPGGTPYYIHMRMLEQKRAITGYSSEHGHFTCPTADDSNQPGGDPDTPGRDNTGNKQSRLLCFLHNTITEVSAGVTGTHQ